MGPPLPSAATSDAEQVAFGFDPPQDPGEVFERLNRRLPAGVCILQAWVARPRVREIVPSQLNEAVYLLQWSAAPPAVGDHLARLLHAADVPFIRVREKKTQHFNARPCIHDACLLPSPHPAGSLLLTLVASAQGSLRPDEFFQLLGFCPAPGELRIHRVALLHSAWRQEPRPTRVRLWRRQ